MHGPLLILENLITLFWDFFTIDTRWISGMFCQNKLFSRHRRTLLGAQTYVNYCLAQRQPIRAVVYLQVLNRQKQAARQLLFVDNARAGDFQPRF
jgi:hypothetical protein